MARPTRHAGQLYASYSDEFLRLEVWHAKDITPEDWRLRVALSNAYDVNEPVKTILDVEWREDGMATLRRRVGDTPPTSESLSLAETESTDAEHILSVTIPIGALGVSPDLLSVAPWRLNAVLSADSDTEPLLVWGHPDFNTLRHGALLRFEEKPLS
jgi:hypothetical protein